MPCAMRPRWPPFEVFAVVRSFLALAPLLFRCSMTNLFVPSNACVRFYTVRVLLILLTISIIFL